MSDLESGTTEKEAFIMASGPKLLISERVARTFVTRPKTCFFSCWAITLLLAAIPFLTGWFKLGDMNGWVVRESVEAEQFDALLDAWEKLDLKVESEKFQKPIRSELTRFAGVQFILEWEDSSRRDNIFTSANLQGLCELQRIITEDREYRKFCLTNDARGFETECLRLQTDLVSFFYPTAADRGACKLLPQDQVDSVLAQARSDESALFFLHRSFLETGEITLTRSEVLFAGPLGPDSGTGNKTYNEVSSSGEQGKLYDAFLDKVEKKLLEAGNLKGSLFRSAYTTSGIPVGDGARIKFFSYRFIDTQATNLANSDLLLASVSALLVGVLMYVHIRSLWITVNVVLAVLFSFPMTLTFYRGLYGIDYFNTIHVVTIFLMLGIGADNIFVFFDMFRQSTGTWVHMRGFSSVAEAQQANAYGTGDGAKEMLIARLAYAWMRTAMAIFNTSATTAIAFLATASSPLTPVSGFGFFAATCVLLNYILTLTLFPGIIIMYHNHFADRPCCCACFRSRAVGSETSKPVSSPSSATESFLIEKVYLPLLRPKIGSALAILGLLSLFVAMVTFASNISTPTKQDENFKSSHMFTGFLDQYDGFSGTKGSNMAPFLVWGIDGIDRADYTKWKPLENLGSVVFQDGFDMSSRKSQEYLLQVCDSVASLSCLPSEGSTRYPACGSDNLILSDGVYCTIRVFHEWHDTAYPNETQAIDLGEENKSLWLDRLKEFALTSLKASQFVGFVGHELRFFVMQYETSIKPFLPEQIKAPVLDILDNWAAEIRQKTPSSMDSFFQTSVDMVWIVTERNIVSGIFKGFAIAAPCVFVILLIGTRNVLITIFALASITCIVSLVLGTAYLLDWSLGIGEAIAAVMVIGLSVDYVLHLGQVFAHAFEEGHKSAEKRFEYTARYMGPTVVAASATTAVSSSVMFFTQLAFFNKMGTLIVLTIVGSLGYSMFFFMPLLKFFMGTSGARGDISKCFTSKTK